MYCTLTNTQDYSTAGDCYENDMIRDSNSGKLAFIMNGTASQSLTSDYLQFQGGVKILNGTFRVNFNQRDSYYYWRGSDAVTVRFVTEDGGSTFTTFSHGDLEMSGGAFGSTADSSSYGAFRFTNIAYTAGTINLRLAGASQMDSIDLTTYYNRVADNTRGTESVTYEKVEGGKISFAEGAGKMTFQFDGDLTWVIDNGTGAFDLNDGKGAKVITWDNEKGSDLSKDNFAANLFESSDGDKYQAEFSVEDDGLYVKYVPVPESAQIAAIIGTLALALAVIRRKKSA